MLLLRREDGETRRRGDGNSHRLNEWARRM